MPALTGIRVIDFGQYIAGPLAGQLLADQGADVIRVDPPTGPAWDTPANATWNRGKRSITLDLKSPDDVATARHLIASADVVIENFRPGVINRLGLGSEAMTNTNPGILYLSMPGFAADDPRAAIRAWEGVVGAASATYRPSASPNHAGSDQPVYTPMPIASAYAALLGVLSVGMALVARERDGRGQHIEVPLYDAMFPAIGLYGLRIVDGPPRPLRASPWVRQYECADGRWVQFHAAFTRFILQFIDAAGVGDWREDGVTERHRVNEEPELAAELLDRMTALFKTRPAQEWEDLINAAGTPTAICRPSAEWIDHPHATQSSRVVEIDDPTYGPMRQPGVQARLTKTPGHVQGPAPTLNADRDAILAELSGDGAAGHSGTEDLRNILDGVKVLDLCIILAGPTCGRTLSEFGADVIKIDGPSREDGILFHHDVNRAKRSVLLDLKTGEGQEIFWKLVDQSDVIVQNYRKGVTDRLGIGYEAVRARKPDIIYASLNAYGHDGPWADRPGWEQLAQAATGMQERFGDGPPVLQPYAINDYGTGLTGAYAVALAMLHKQRTGEGQHVNAALAYTACTLQSSFFQDYEGKEWSEPRGQSTLGDGPLHRLYRAADGWLFLGARESDLAAIEQVPGLQGAGSLRGAVLASHLESAFDRGNVDDWVQLLIEAGCGAHRATAIDDVMDDPYAVQHGLSLTREHDDYGLIRTTGTAPRLSRTPVRPGQPASPPGIDAPSVLADIGMEDQLADLVAAGVLVVDGVPAL